MHRPPNARSYPVLAHQTQTLLHSYRLELLLRRVHYLPYNPVSRPSGSVLVVRVLYDMAADAVALRPYSARVAGRIQVTTCARCSSPPPYASISIAHRRMAASTTPPATHWLLGRFADRFMERV